MNLNEMFEHYINLKFQRKILYNSQLNTDDFYNDILIPKKDAENILTELLDLRFENNKDIKIPIKIKEGDK